MVFILRINVNLKNGMKLNCCMKSMDCYILFDNRYGEKNVLEVKLLFIIVF